MSKVSSLAYFVAQSTDLSRWKDYAEKVLGAMTSAAPDGGLYIKLDELKYRILIVPGDSDRYLASGWALSPENFESAVAALKAAGTEVTPASDAEKAQRCVNGLARFTDPAGNLHELAHGYNGGESPFASPIGVAGFKTGAQGAGHTVLPMGTEQWAPDYGAKFDATLKLFTEVLGFGISDIFNFKPAPEAPNMRIYFLHAASGRHHSLALAEMGNPVGNVHVMVEVNEKEDVDKAEKRREAAGVKLMATMGQHENDKMTSFYMMTPGNFALEYGFGGISVDPKTWKTTETKQVSIWGHDFSVGFK